MPHAFPILPLAAPVPLPGIRIRTITCAEVVDTAALSWTEPVPPSRRESPTDRRAQPADFLLPIARRWLAGLPAPVRPRALALRYPRLANRLAAAWDDDASLNLVFDDLLIDHRGHRRGFPPVVKADLHRLWRYWQHARPGAPGGAAAA